MASLSNAFITTETFLKNKEHIIDHSQIAANWWVFPMSDCPKQDIVINCKGQTVDQCKALCQKTAGCGGFNYPSGFLKNANCQNSMAPERTVDLYVLHDGVQPQYNWPPIWPHPAEYTSSNDSSQVVGVQSFSFYFLCPNTSTDLKNAFSRFTTQFFPHRTTNVQSKYFKQLNVNVANPNAELQMGVDESYTLEIPAGGVTPTLTAATQFGAYHGLETLSQLIQFNFDDLTYFIPGVPWKITDYPRFVHRELLVDTSRHFQPLRSMKHIIDAMAYSKANVLHWHVVDDQSFPFTSKNFPEISAKSAYSKQERYSVYDAEDIVEYARQKGIRVMVEFDMPAHAQGFCGAHPEICDTYCKETFSPVTNATFDFIEKFLDDVTSIFPDHILHLGGDEFNNDCWGKDPVIAAWMAKNQYDFGKAFTYFINRVHEIAARKSRDVANWNEVWDRMGTSLPKSTIIHQWVGRPDCGDAAKNGYRCIWSQNDFWYLDHLNVNWMTMHIQEPCTQSQVPDALCTGPSSLLLGGGGEMWGETVDSSDVVQTVWPRFGAIAERLWSPKTVTFDNVDVIGRYNSFRCYLNQRGVAAAPATNGEARQGPPGPGSCYRQ